MPDSEERNPDGEEEGAFPDPGQCADFGTGAITRRQFLKIAGVAGVAIGMGTGLGQFAAGCTEERAASTTTKGATAGGAAQTTTVPTTPPTTAPAPPLDLQPDAWVQTGGPSGGPLETVELHPTDPDTVFTGGWGGVYKSTDGGGSWTLLAPVGGASKRVTRLIIHPETPQVMYALAEEPYRTDDGGETWTCLIEEQFACMAMDPSGADRLLLGRGDGLVRYSDDAGASWADITGDLPGFEKRPGPGYGPGYPIKAAAFGKGSELWVGTGIAGGVGNGLLHRSAKAGGPWTPVEIPGQAASSQIHSIFVDRQDRATLYVGLANIYNAPFDRRNDVYLAKTTDDGANWVTFSLPTNDSMVNVMGRAPYDTALYVGDGGCVFRSDNDCQSWTEVTPRPGQNGDMYDIAVDPRDTKVLYLPRRAHGIVKSTDRGETWTPINQGILNTVIALIAAGNEAGSTVYAATMEGEGTFKSTDWGQTWENVTNRGIAHPWADELAVSPIDERTVWEVADVGQVFVSRDYGNSWKMTIDPRRGGEGFRAGTILATAIAPSDPDVVHALKSGFGIFRSDDGGSRFRFLHQSDVDYTYALAVHPGNPDIVFSGYSPKPFQDWAMVRRSTDGGASWTTVLEVPHSSGVTSVAIDPRDPRVVYAGSAGPSTGGGGQIYRSADGGDTWAPLNPHFTMLTVWGQPQLVGDPADPATAYAATWLGGTWKTTDAGKTWTLLDKAPLSSTALSVDPADPQVIYAADRTAPKVWKSSDGGVAWAAADFSSDRAFLINRVLVAGDAVYASTFGPGSHDGKLYRSSDGGSTWTDITNGLPRSVLDVAVDPSDLRTIYVTTHIHGAYKSRDGGANWSELKGFPDIGGYDIEVDPVSPNVLYAAGMGATTVPEWCLEGGYTFTDPAGVYKSTDGGATWTNVLRTSNECRAVRVHPDDHELLLASALSDGFFVSRDGGATWANRSEGLGSRNLTSVWAAGGKVYAGTQGSGVWGGDLKVSTGAVKWAASRSNKPIPTVHNIQVRLDPADPDRIYAGVNPGGLFRSDDGGRFWYDKNFLTPSVAVDDPKRQGYYTFAINPEDPGEVWVGTYGRGIYKSYDGQDYNIGANGADRLMLGKQVNALAFHPELGVLAATEQGVFHTTDGGATWKQYSVGIHTPQTRTLEVFSTGRVLCGTAGYELYTRRPADARWAQLPSFDNFGTFWPVWNDRPLYQYSQLLFHPTDPKTIYFGTFPAGVFKSLDGGESWQEYNVGWLNDGVFTLVTHPEDPDILYAGTYNGVNRSLDAGGHWQRWDNGWPGEQWVFSIAFDPRDATVMYACSKNGENEGTGRDGFHGTVMKSADGGATWSAITEGLDVNQEFYKIIADKLAPGTLYLATQFQGVWISRDGGGHWEEWNEGLTNLQAGTNGNNVTNTMALSGDGKLLYFGTTGSGVFRRTVSPR